MAEWMTASHFLVFIFLYVQIFYSVKGKVTQKCRRGRFGAECEYRCHCYGDRVCNRITGKCYNFQCSRGWYGRPCQQQNVALGRPAWQTTTLCVRNSTTSCYNASRAIDGLINPNLNNGSCSASLEQSSDGNSENWLVVELDKTYTIFRLRLYNRQDCCGEKLAGVKVSVFSPIGKTWHTCFVDETPHGKSPGKTVNVTCRNAIKGNRVAVIMNGTLALCEVQILVCSPQWYGDQCQYPCHGKQCHKCDPVGVFCKDDTCHTAADDIMAVVI